MRPSTWVVASLVLTSGCDDGGEPALAAPARFEAVADERSVSLSWRNPDAAPVAIVRYPHPFDGAAPDGERLVAGRRFDPGGIVLYVGSGDGFVDRSMDRCAAHTYHAYALGDGAERSSPAIIGPIALPAPTPGAPPASLDGVAEGGGVRLAWNAPANPNDFVRVSRAHDGEVIVVHTRRGAGEHLDRADLVAGETYRYALSACTLCGACSEPGPEARVSVPVDFAPADLVVDPNGPTVDFTWTAPRGAIATMRLLAREGAPVEGPSDPEAEVLYEGEDAEAHVAMTSFTPDVFEDETRYHFAVHACAGSDCSEGAVADYAFTLGDALRGGGHVVYFEHGEAGICVDRTDLGTADETNVPDWWRSCARSCDVATAEQLSAPGYGDAQAAGLALRNAGVRFDRAMASEYCRAVETLQRLEVISSSAIETREELTPFVHGSEDVRCEATLLLLGGAALGAPDRNAVIVGHPELPSPCELLDGLGPGGAAVVRPTEAGPVVLARIAPDTWQDAL